MRICVLFQILLIFCLGLNLVSADNQAGVKKIKKTKEEPYDANPAYNYAFDVADEGEQMYQAHTQTLDDKVSFYCLIQSSSVSRE